VNVGELERRVSASAAWDRRHPDPAQDYGIHGVEFRFSLVGEQAAVSFNLSTGWLLPSTLGVSTTSSSDYRAALWQRSRWYPQPAGLFLHFADPVAEYMREPSECDLLPGGRCYGCVSSHGADRPYFALIERGDEGLWEQLAGELRGFLKETPCA
jgi:hypothetical protein